MEQELGLGLGKGIRLEVFQGNGNEEEVKQKLKIWEINGRIAGKILFMKLIGICCQHQQHLI